MTAYKITFNIDNTAQLIIPLEDPAEVLSPLYRGKILLLLNSHTFLLSKTTVYHNMLDLVDLLKKVLNQKLFLDSSMIKDIGYFHNEHLCRTSQLPTYEFSNGGIDWIGYSYHLWSARDGLISLDSWIYNGPDGSIIFEITPLYPYMFSEPEEEPGYITYDEWIKTYKPYFITTLSKKTAQDWLERAEIIIKTVENNQKKWTLLTKDEGEC